VLVCFQFMIDQGRDIMSPFLYRFPVPENQLYDIGNWHSPYFFLAFFEARQAFSENLGVSTEKLREDGYAINVIRLECDYSEPLLRGDVALIEVAPIKIGRSSMQFRYRVYKDGDEERKLRAEGKVLQVLVDRRTKKSAPIPDWFRSHLEANLAKEE